MTGRRRGGAWIAAFLGAGVAVAAAALWLVAVDEGAGRPEPGCVAATPVAGTLGSSSQTASRTSAPPPRRERVPRAVADSPVAVQPAAPVAAHVEPGALQGTLRTIEGPLVRALVTIGGTFVQSADDGSFRLRDLPEGDHTVVVAAPGFVRREERWTSATAEPVKWFLERAATFEVRVHTHDGIPVRDADVALIFDRPGGPFRRFVERSGADGIARFREAPSGKASVWVHSGRASGDPTVRVLAQPEVKDGGVADVTAQVGDALTGRVEDEHGAAVAFAQLIVLEENRIPRRIFADAVTGTDGRFTIGVRRGQGGATLYVVVGALGGGGWRFAAMTKSVPVGAADAVLVLEPGATLAGRVVDDAGLPVARRDVSIDPVHGCLTPPLVVRTDADGRFRATGLASGKHAITLVTGSKVLAPAFSVPEDLPAGDAVRDFVVPQ